MFTGIIQKIGTVQSAKKKGGELELVVRVEKPWPHAIKKGESIAVDGVCLTVIRSTRNSFTTQLVPETLEATTLGDLSAGKRINLERSLRLQDSLGGHFVFGHVDTTGKIVKKVKRDDDYLIRISASKAVRKYLVPKGSVAVDGISLTIQHFYADGFEIAIIPHTALWTTIVSKKVGDRVNIEADMMAKQVYQYLNHFRSWPKH